MKRILMAFLLSVACTSASAKLFIDVDILDTVITQHFADDNTNAVAATQAYLTMIQAGNGVTVDGLYTVCVAGGFDIKSSDGREKCDNFVTDLLNRATLDYHAVCGADKGKSGGTEYCIEGVFENGWTKTGDGYDLNTGVMQGRAFAAAYIQQKYKVDVLCSKNIRTAGNDDFMKCTSLDNTKFFEVRFDDLRQSIDSISEIDQKYAICHVYGMERAAKDITNPGCKASGAAECEKLKSLAGKLSYDVVFGTRDLIVTIGDTTNVIPTSGCWFQNRTNNYTTNGKFDESKLAKIDGLRNQQFYGIHSLNGNIHDAVREYVRGVVGADAVVECASNTIKIPNINGAMNQDEVLRCNVNGAPIDFVFDDTSELFGYERRAGESGLGCAALGGTYTGTGCINVGATQCNELIARISASCPKCSKPVWQPEQQRCYLPDSNMADNINFAAKIGGITALTVGGVVVTVFSGGVAGALAWAVVAEAVGGVMEITAEIRLGRAAEQFLAQTAKCGGDACGNCAEDILSQLHTHIAQATDYQPIEVAAIDSEMARLLTCLPEDSELAEKIANGIMNENQGIGGEWTPDQIMRAAGATLGLATMFTSIARTAVISAQRGTSLSQTAQALRRMENIARARAARVARISARFEKMATIKEYPDEGKYVYQMWDGETGNIVYLKYTNADEVDYTIQASRFKPSSEQPIVHIVNVRSADQDELAIIAQANGLPVKDAGSMYFMTDAVPDGATLGQLILQHDTAIKYLDGQDITPAEARQLLHEITEMNLSGIHHGDLNSNMIIHRDIDGNLQAYIIDFEAWSRASGNDEIHVRSALDELLSKTRQGNLESDMPLPQNYVISDSKFFLDSNPDWAKLTTAQQAEFINAYRQLNPGELSFPGFVQAWDTDVEKLRRGLHNIDAYSTDLRAQSAARDIARSADMENYMATLGKLSDAEIDEFRTAFERFAPGNQDFASFVAMWDGDVAKMRDATKSWGPIQEMQFSELTELRSKRWETKIKLDDLTAQRQQEYERLGLNAEQIAKHQKDDAELQALTSEYNSIAAQVMTKENGFYSTFDPQVKQLRQTYAQAADDAFTDGERLGLKIETIKNSADLVNNNNVYMRAQQLRETYLDVIGNDSDLLDMALRFDTLSDADRALFARQLTSRMGRAECVDGACVVDWISSADPGVSETLGGYYDNGFMYLVKEKSTTLDDFIRMFAHERTHYIDDVAPNQGSLGAQIAGAPRDGTSFSASVYTNTDNAPLDVYRANWTEQHAYGIGDNVGYGFTDELKRRYGK